MNHASWFIYIAGVTDNLAVIITGIGCFCFVACGVCWFAFALCDAADSPDVSSMLKRTAVRLPLLGAILLFIACFIPAKTTMYAIAASQIGESVATSQEGREMIDDTKQILRDYLKSLKNGRGS